MKIAKNILKVIVALLALPLLMALFVKKEYHVERDIIINQPSDSVFNYIKYLKNQNDYSKWASLDPQMIKTFEGTDATVGFVSAWKSNQKDVGQGEQTITAIYPNERIDYDLHFIKPFESHCKAYMTTEAVDSLHTKVCWGFEGKMTYPLNLVLLVMNMDEAIGKDLQTGLNNLSQILIK